MVTKPGSVGHVESMALPHAEVAAAGDPNATLVSAPTSGTAQADAFAVLEALAGSVEAPADWAAEHDHYLYGTPKRGSAGE
jgi:hypothetical protein